jgi:hypothetical protein
VTSAPYRVSMSKKTQRAIWARLPTGEFNTPHGGSTVAQVPFPVGETVASAGLYAWDSASAPGNTVDLPRQQVLGYAPGPDVGRFQCDGTTNGYSGDTFETCTHHAGEFGYISVKFMIEPNPNQS